MMKQLAFVGALVGALGAGAAWAQTTAGTKPDARRTAKPDEAGGHATPKQQPNTAPAPAVPTGDVQLGSIRLTKSVKADGKPLPAGTYQVRVTSQPAGPTAKGETPASERWAEFVQNGQVKGREVVTIIPRSEIDSVQKDTPPKGNAGKVETLKGGEYVRVWFNKDGNHYLIHLPS